MGIVSEKLDLRAVTRELDRLVERGCTVIIAKGHITLEADEEVVELYADNDIIEEQPYTPLALWDYLKRLVRGQL